MAHAEVRDRIEHGVVHRRGRADRARLADALRTEWVDGRRRDGVIEGERRQFRRADEGIVGEIAREQIPGFVVNDFLEQRLRRALSDRRPRCDL